MNVPTDLAMKMSIYFIKFSAVRTFKHKIVMTENNVFLCTQSKCYVYFVFDVLVQKERGKKKAVT